MIIMVPNNKISKIMYRLTSLAHITQGTTKKTTSIHHSQVKNSFLANHLILNDRAYLLINVFP